VAVVGNSCAFMVVPRPATVDDEPYPGLLEEALLDRGVVSRAMLNAQWHTTAKEAVGRLEAWVRDPLPDVLVVNLGVVDCQARVAPTWLYRHVYAWLPGLTGWSTSYRRRVVPWLRRAVRLWVRFGSRHAPLWLSRVSPKTFRRSVELLVQRASRDFRVLVLVLDIDGPGEPFERVQPGIGERIAAYNSVLADLVAARRDERIVLLRASETVAGDLEGLLPDGLHRSAAGHRLLADQIADAVVDHWHLLKPGA
jgi:lysophospholipase L1-like esterase